MYQSDASLYGRINLCMVVSVILPTSSGLNSGRGFMARLLADDYQLSLDASQKPISHIVSGNVVPVGANRVGFFSADVHIPIRGRALNQITWSH